MTQKLKQLLKKSFYSIGTLWLSEGLIKPFISNVIILVYHRVLPSDQINKNNIINYGNYVTVEQFEKQMEYISERFKVITLDDMLNGIKVKNKPYVVITFDDGYKDNLIYALPVLEKYNIPTIIYIISAVPENIAEVWWFELEMICGSQKSVELNWLGKNHQWEMADLFAKERCFKEIKEIIIKLSSCNQVSKFIENFGGRSRLKNFNETFLSWDEIIEMDQHPLVTIGSHTHNHLCLKNLDIKAARNEIMKSKNLIEKHLGHTIYHLSFPYGSKLEVSDSNKRLAEKVGYKTAVTADNYVLGKEFDRYSLPRQVVSLRDNLARFKVKLSGWNSLFRTNI